MTEKQNERDFTDPDTCDVINEEPLTFKGLTSFEFKAVIFGSMVIGLIIGVPIAFLISMPSLPLVTSVSMPIAAVIFMGKLAAAFRRGKPVGYLNQKVWIVICQFKRSKNTSRAIYETRSWGLGRNRSNE
ncbi:DUF3487 family protein [Vibrio ostreicida]|uniref:DUF3487 family protein n=1 Tax=Vibrio ostreicida TaxID=526588 RepID=UPI003B5C9D21